MISSIKFMLKDTVVLLQVKLGESKKIEFS